MARPFSRIYTSLLIDPIANKVIPCVLCLMLLLIYVLFWIYVPTQNALQQARDRAVQIKHNYQQLLEVDQISSRLNGYSGYLKDLSVKLEKSYSGSLVTSEISNVFAKNSLLVSDESYRRPRVEDQIINVEVQFTVSGEYASIRSMISELNELSFIVSIEQATMERIDDQLVKAQVIIELYFSAKKEDSN